MPCDQANTKPVLNRGSALSRVQHRRYRLATRPPPTTAPLPDDFNAITKMRDSTVYDESAHSALDIDYNAITISPVTPWPLLPVPSTSTSTSTYASTDTCPSPPIARALLG